MLNQDRELAASSQDPTIFHRDDLNLIVEFAGCSLDEKPGSNWVADAGGLPDYVCRIAKAVKKTGKPTSQAIAIALSRVKKWAAGGDDVDADTQAKAAKALAEWEKLKAKNKARDVKASHAQGEILLLTDKVSVFNVDLVRRAWEAQAEAWRTKWRKQYPYSPMEEGPPYSYITEMWTDHLIVRSDEKLYWVDYTVDSDNNITFGDQKEVRTEYVVIGAGDMVGEDMGISELRQLLVTVGPCHTATDEVLLSIGKRPSALETVLAARPSPA